MNLAKTVWNSKFNFRGFKFLNWGRLEFPKLLLFFLNNLKNSQHESCSTFYVLQLSCWPLFKIPTGFWVGGLIWKRGHFSEICIFKITCILYWNFKNSKHQSCTSCQELQPCFWTQPKILLNFWLMQKGANLGSRNQGFSPPLAFRKISTLGL